MANVKWKILSFAYCTLLTAHSTLIRVSITLVLIKPGARSPDCVLADKSAEFTFLRVLFRSSGMSTLVRFSVLIAVLGVASYRALAQQTNPVDRKVTNPMTDTP